MSHKRAKRVRRRMRAFAKSLGAIKGEGDRAERRREQAAAVKAVEHMARRR